ncbi:MAG: hypothetical protein Q4B96_02905 [Bacillota bacterium]|nr:hypothetical protein [Bacillota bacterium]
MPIIDYSAEKSKENFDDPITYDDNGNIIPLSQRFNPEQQDIRFSLPTDDLAQIEAILRAHYGLPPKATSSAPSPISGQTYKPTKTQTNSSMPVPEGQGADTLRGLAGNSLVKAADIGTIADEIASIDVLGGSAIYNPVGMQQSEEAAAKAIKRLGGSLNEPQNTPPAAKTAGLTAENEAGRETNPKNIIPYTPKEAAKIASNKIKIMRSISDFKIFIQEALSSIGHTDKTKLFLGKISNDLAAQIHSSTGVDVRNYNLSISNHEIQKIIRNSHGKASAEMPRGQRAVTEEDILLLLKVADAPDNIYLSNKTTQDGKPVIIFEKMVGDKYVYTQYVSDKHHTLDGQTLYITHKKSPRTVSDNESSPIITPETNSGKTFLDPTLSQTAPSVNSGQTENSATPARVQRIGMPEGQGADTLRGLAGNSLVKAAEC